MAVTADISIPVKDLDAAWEFGIGKMFWVVPEIVDEEDDGVHRWR
jgi:hypothetical protein